jgi:hypothetical protein
MKTTTIQNALAKAFHVLNEAAGTHMRDGDTLEIGRVTIEPRRVGSPHPLIEITISVDEMRRSFDGRFIEIHGATMFTRYSIELVEERIRVQAFDWHRSGPPEVPAIQHPTTTTETP